jgi:ribosomal protein L18
VERVEVDAVDDGHAHRFVISESKKNQIMQIIKKSEYLGIVNNETTSLLNKKNFTVG